jgi:hypothetical protein
VDGFLPQGRLNLGGAADRGPEVGRHSLAPVSLDTRKRTFQAIDRFDHFLALAKAYDNFIHAKTHLGEDEEYRGRKSFSHS